MIEITLTLWIATIILLSFGLALSNTLIEYLLKQAKENAKKRKQLDEQNEYLYPDLPGVVYKDGIYSREDGTLLYEVCVFEKNEKNPIKLFLDLKDVKEMIQFFKDSGELERARKVHKKATYNIYRKQNNDGR